MVQGNARLLREENSTLNIKSLFQRGSKKMNKTPFFQQVELLLRVLPFFVQDERVALKGRHLPWCDKDSISAQGHSFQYQTTRSEANLSPLPRKFLKRSKCSLFFQVVWTRTAEATFGQLPSIDGKI